MTNGGEEHTRGLLERGGLADAVELVVTVDEVRAYKPHAAPYRRAAERLEVGVNQLVLVTWLVGAGNTLTAEPRCAAERRSA